MRFICLGLLLQIQKFCETLDDDNDGFAFGLKRLEELRSEQDVLLWKFEFAKFNLEDSKRRAKKTQDQYENAALLIWKSKADIEVVR